jgi:hypothetical protein
MRTRFFVLGCSGLVAVAGIVEACGGDSTETPAPTDAGKDVVADVAKDTNPPVEDDAATCDLKGDFTKSIPDAAIADGASTTGLCLQCAKAKCAGEIEACNKDCPCQGVADDALQCFIKNSNKSAVELIQLCGGEFGNVPAETQQIGFALGQCVLGKCKAECPADISDAGPKDGGDGG